MGHRACTIVVGERSSVIVVVSQVDRKWMETIIIRKRVDDVMRTEEGRIWQDEKDNRDDDSKMTSPNLPYWAT